MRKIILILLVFCCHCAYADSLVHRMSAWSNLKFEGRIGVSDQQSKWLYLLEGDLRIGNANDFLDRATVRGALGYQLKDALSLWLGYDFKPIQQEDDFELEQRIWQQAAWGLIESDHLVVVSRSRLEQRTRLERRGVNWRFRQRFTFIFGELFHAKIRPVFYEEVFLNLNHPEWINPDSLNQQRAFLGFELPLEEHVVLRLGYVNQYLLREPHNRMNHVIYMSLRRNTIV